MSRTGSMRPVSSSTSRLPYGLKTPSNLYAGRQPSQSAKKRYRRRVPLIIGGLAIYCFASYGTYLYVAASKTPAVTNEIAIAEDVSDRYNRTAETFDKDVDLTETIMGLGWLRRSMAKQASGHVLEVSVGTGRNSQYYNTKRCKSFTFVDKSPEMIAIAKRKFQDAHPGYNRCRFVTQSAQDPISCPSSTGFDTVVQTMGLCSTPQPSELLVHLGSLANPETGRILLLEHGRSHYEWLNRILDNNAPAHADKHGCWWNRDIEKIVDESHLEVVTLKRYHFGTTYWIELRPKRH